MAISSKKIAGRDAVTGTFATSVPGFVLVKVGSRKKLGATPTSESASTLVQKAARALNKPGISKDAVFKGKTKNVYSYSVDTSDISRVVRVAADGRRTVGRLVGDKFVVVKAA